MNSRNSSQPQSTYGLRKTNSLCEPSCNKTGGQHDHKGNTLERVALAGSTPTHPRSHNGCQSNRFGDNGWCCLISRGDLQQGHGRRRMIGLENRLWIVLDIGTAHTDGAKLYMAYATTVLAMLHWLGKAVVLAATRQ